MEYLDMITIFYSVIFTFIFSEVYHFFNKKRLDIIFRNKDIDKTKMYDILFYVIKTISIFWPLIGLFSGLREFFLLIIIVNLIKFVLYHINYKLYQLYISLLHFINISLYLLILYHKFIR